MESWGVPPGTINMPPDAVGPPPVIVEAPPVTVKAPPDDIWMRHNRNVRCPIAYDNGNNARHRNAAMLAGA